MTLARLKDRPVTVLAGDAESELHEEIAEVVGGALREILDSSSDDLNRIGRRIAGRFLVAALAGRDDLVAEIGEQVPVLLEIQRIHASRAALRVAGVVVSSILRMALSALRIPDLGMSTGASGGLSTHDEG